MTIINSIYKGKRYAILLTTILTFYAPVLFAQHIADSALVEVANGQQPEWRRTSAISSIRGEDLMKTTSASLGNSLQGQLPGLTLLQQSGEKRMRELVQKEVGDGVRILDYTHDAGPEPETSQK